MSDKEPALSTITDEDLAFERELQRMNAQEPPIGLDEGEVQIVKQEKIQREMLGDHMEVKPATSVNELLEQVHLAKEVGADGVEATERLIRYYCRNAYPDDVGYFVFQGIKVWIEGYFKTHAKLDKMTIEQKLFPKTKPQPPEPAA